MSSEIVDAHCHIASLRHTPRSFFDGAIDNLEAAALAFGAPISRSALSAAYEQRMSDDNCDALVKEMNAAGISKTVLLAADFTYALKDCALTIAESFAEHEKVLERHPGRFAVLGGVDPRWGQDGIDLFERYAKSGFAGLKVYPPCGFSPSDRSMFPYYEICAANGLPVLIHIGPTSPSLAFDLGSPILADEACRNFPAVNFILAHAAAAYVEECAMMASHRPNVFLDVSAFQGTSDKGGAIAALTRRGINHKILFGTDWPVFCMQGPQSIWVRSALSALESLSPAERGLVMGGNARRLFKNL